MSKPLFKPPPPPVQVDITDWSADFEGQACFQKPNGPLRKLIVPCSMPGDRVEATLRTSRRGICHGSLESLIAASPQRITARCPHFGVCGGCRLQHVPTQLQLQLKQEKVYRLLSPLGDQTTDYAPIVAAQHAWEYRNKMEFSFSSDSKGERYLGLIGLHTRGRVTNLEVCYLVEPWMARALQVVRDWWQAHALTAYHPFRNRGCLRTLTVRQGLTSGDRLLMLTVSGNPEDALPQEAMKDWVKRLQAFCATDEAWMQSGATLSCFIRIQQICKGAPTQFYEMLLTGPGVIREALTVQAQVNQTPQTLSFHIGPTSFFQPNVRQAERLYSLALQMAQLNCQTTLYDLCCGTATLGIAAARFVQRVIGVELSPEALIDAKENCTLNGCQNVTFHRGDVAEVVARLAAEEDPQDSKHRVVVVDPPRAGLVEAAHRAIVALHPQQIVSISCNPVSQARDLAAWRLAGYRVVRVQPVECFPHTPHIENIVLLERVT